MAAVSIVLFHFTPVAPEQLLTLSAMPRKIFPPTDSELPHHATTESQAAEAEAEIETSTSSTGNTQTFASTSITPEPASKKQKTTPTTSQNLNNDDDKDWEAVEKPQPSLASSTMESATSTSELGPPSESGPLDESTVNVDSETAAAAAKAELESKGIGNTAEPPGGGLEDDDGVEIEKPQGLEEDEGVKVEKPIAASALGKAENLLGKDW